MNLKRRRIEALTTVWSILVSKPIKNREEVVEILKDTYNSMSIEPIRGSSNPPDLYDKEMASLYIIGKWGLGIDRDISEEILKTVFSTEMLFEKVLNVLSKVSTREDFCKEVDDLCTQLNDSFIARFLRFAFTLYYFGFIKFEDLVTILKKLYNFYDMFQDTVRRFTKFVIAYEVGARIASGQIKSLMDINMTKNVIALNIGIPKATPSLSYIVEVSKHFFTLPENIVKSIKSLSSKKKQKSDNNV